MLNKIFDLIINLVKFRLFAVADDKLNPPASIQDAGSGSLARRGKVASTTEFKNFVGSLRMPCNDSIAGILWKDFIYCRTTPVGDADYEALPIGSIAFQHTVTSKAITDAEMYMLTTNGWEKFLTHLDADWADLITVTALATAGAGTYTAAHIEGGYIRRDPAGADRTDTTSTAALMVAAVESAAVGSALRFYVKNVADADEIITLAGGTGVTLAPTDIFIKPGTTKEFIVVFTNVTSGSEAATLYDMDQVKDFATKLRVSDTTAGANTWSAAEMINDSLLVRDPTGADRSDVTDTAANLVAAFPGVRVGSTFEFEIANIADADEVVTLTAGAGVTLSPSTITIGPNGARKFQGVFTNVTAASEAVTIYDMTAVGYSNVNVRTFTKKTVVTAGGGGAITITAAQLLGGYLQNDPAGDVNATTATATQIVAAIENCEVGASFEFVLENTADGAETITLVGGTDVTLASGHTFTPTQNESLRCLFVVTNVGSPAVTVYGLGEFTT